MNCTIRLMVWAALVVGPLDLAAAEKTGRSDVAGADPYMGDYSGSLRTADGRRMQADAQVAPLGGVTTQP